jgi:5-formyltetrahydrofolate cyclo-ligase
MVNIDKINIDNKNVFKKVAEKAVEGVKKVAGKAAESFDKSKLKIKTIDKIKATWNSGKLEKYKEKSSNFNTKRNAIEERIKNLQTKVENDEKGWAEFKKKHGAGEIVSKLESEKIKERQRDFEKIRKFKIKEDKIETKLQYYNNKNVIYENKVKSIVGRVSDKIDKRLDPHEKKMATLSNTINLLNEGIKIIETNSLKLKKELEDLNIQKEGSGSKVLRRAIVKLMDETRDQIKKNDKRIIERSNERIKKQEKYNKVEIKTNKWIDVRKQFTGLVKKGDHYDVNKVKEEPDLNWRDIEVKKPERKERNASKQKDDIEEEARQIIESVDKGGVPGFVSQNLKRVLLACDFDREEISNSRPGDLISKLRNYLKEKKSEESSDNEEKNKENREEKALSFKEYISLWNKLFGHKLLLDINKIKTRDILQEKEIVFLENELRMQYKIMKKVGDVPRGFSERDLKKSLETLRNYL